MERRKPLLNAELRRRGIYLLPNLFTTAALFAGFYAIVQAMNARFEQAALRLARFNTNIDIVDKRFFQGLPSPAAAALCAGLIWIIDDLGVRREDTVRILACVVTLFAGITMVSNVPFYSFKDINLRRSVPFWVMLLIVLGMILISANPPVILFLLFVAYSLSGYIHWLWRWKSKRTAPAVR
jgi:CDP-diacylglycerol--serine O-phosphatidyltransferase